jgi:hypothetical protein
MKTGSSLPELPTKRRLAEVSVQPLAALVSSAGTIRISTLILACFAADAVCIGTPIVHANKCKMLFNIFFNP